MRVFDERAKAEKFKPQAGDTLASIVASHPKCTARNITWQELALYNWATIEPDEVNRALIEIIGCALDAVNAGDPSATRLDPQHGPEGGAKELMIPEVWNRPSLPLEKVHTLKVRTRLPMPAVRISELSPWFIPGSEACDLKYAMEGLPERADKVGWSVWASKYQTATMDTPAPALSELQKFTFTPSDLPIRAEKLAANDQPRQGNYTFADKANEPWKGESKATAGILKPRDGKKRHITVANSPYTVQFSFYKQEADFKEDSAQTCPRIVLDSFWPFWRKPQGAPASPAAPPPAPVLDDTSLKVKWKVENSGGVLKHGQLVIWDMANQPDRPVYRKALGDGDLSDGEHQFDWAAHGGKDVVQAERMPYRVQIQAHTDIDNDNGLALAVMHTEVRLFAPPDLDTHQHPLEDTQCFDFEIAPFVPDESIVANNTKKWYQLQLAKIGLHPGPVNGENHAHYELAHVDFKRSYTKNDVAPFQRMRAVFGEDGDFQTALTRVAQKVEAANGSPPSPPGGASPPASPAAGDADRQRAIFGDPTQLDTPGSEDLLRADDINARLRDKDQDLIVWLEGRHYYTSTVSPDTGAVTDLPDGSFAPNAASPGARSVMGVENYHGELIDGDAFADQDAQSIARPWIPVAFAPPLLSKSQGLAQAAKPAMTDQMREAIGPLRVDWSFHDLEEDLTRIDVTRYNPDRLRTRKFIEEMIKGLEAEHEGKKAQNCPEPYGGLRPVAGSPPASPAAETQYYKKPFGFEDESLAPWRAYDDTAQRKICCLVHDDLGQDAAKVHKKQVGKAGIYFVPSRIGGDGYQFRARVNFDKRDGAYLFPNHEVLVDRYQRLPQAHSAKLRNWRKTSFRAYVAWAPAGEQKWNAWRQPVVEDFRSGYVHFAMEPGAAAPLSMASLYPPGATRTALLDTLQNDSDPLFHHGNDRDLEADFLWPWNQHAQFGAEYFLAYPTTWSDFSSDVCNRTYTRFAPKLILDIILKVEQTRGLLRGHVLLEFRGSEQSYVGHYRCLACNTDMSVLQNTNAALAAPVANCCGAPNLDLLEEYEWGCNNCPHTETDQWPTSNPPAGPYTCPTGCGGDIDVTAGPNDLVETGEQSLVNTAMGLALGGSILITLQDNEDWPWWTHEIGHNRQLQHAGREGGFQPAQHDSLINSHDAILVNEVAMGNLDAGRAQWDRVCTMTYTTSRQAGPLGDDRQQFCGKCILKGRGWRVEGLPDPGTLDATVQGP